MSNNKPRLITLGCSLTYFPGKKEHLAKLLNLENINLSISASSNQLQSYRLIDYIVNNEIKNNDIIYWQITGLYRGHARLETKHKNEIELIQKNQFNEPQKHYTISEFKNLFDSCERYDILSNSPLVSPGNFDFNGTLQTILGMIILTKSYCPKILISFGWKNMMSADHFKTFKNKLFQNNIDFVDECILDFTIENKLELTSDRKHPAPSAGALYAEQILFKKIKELKWI